MHKKRVLTPKFLMLSLVILVVSGCQNHRQVNNQLSLSNENSVTTSPTIITKNPWKVMREDMVFNIPGNARITDERNKILRSKRSLEDNLRNSEPYIYYIANKLDRNNLPPELALLPLLESSYNPLAVSPAQASGLWQMMPTTAKQYGLAKSKVFDPSKDLIASTNAALILLQTLNRSFDGDWLLTLAAYNAGEGRVKQAMASNQAKGLPTNYWALKLPQHTMQYVPKLLAMVDIIKNGNRYNVELPSFSYNNALVKLDLSQKITLEEIALYSGINLAELRDYNAGYIQQTINGPYHLYIPATYVDNLHQKLQEQNLLSSEVSDITLEKATQHILPNNNNQFDSLATNKIYNAISDKDIQAYTKVQNQNSSIVHQVKSGDNLFSIAKAYQVKVSDILQWNNMKKGEMLKPGDKLTINIKSRNNPI